MTQAAAIIALRILAVIWISVGSFQAIANLIDGFRAFDPTYLGHFFMSQLLRPTLAIAFGVVIAALSGPLGRRIAARVQDKP